MNDGEKSNVRRFPATSSELRRREKDRIWNEGLARTLMELHSWQVSEGHYPVRPGLPTYVPTPAVRAQIAAAEQAMKKKNAG